MSEIERFTRHDSGDMLRSKDGGWVRYQDHRARVERLTAEWGKAQAGDDMALSALTSVLRQRYAAQAEIKRMQAELAEAHERCRALELAVEQADEMKAHAEAAATAEESETDRVMAERDAAQAEVERLTAERDQARAEVERLRANGQGMLDTSRPTDEDIWREVFLRCVSEYITGEKRVIVADSMLAEYRKRWPR